MVLDVPKKPNVVPDLKQKDVRETANIGLSPAITDYTLAQHDHSNAAGGANVDHTTGLSNIGSNTHAQIDTAVTASANHIADNSQAHSDYLLNDGDTITGNLTLDDGVGESPKLKLINVSNHTGDIFLQTNGDLRIESSNGNVDMATTKIVNVVDPSDNQDAATKKYVDNNLGINIKTQTYPAASAYSADAAIGTSGDHAFRTFTDGTSDEIFINWVVPQDLANSTTSVNVQIYWRTLAAAALVARFEINWSFASSAEDKEANTGTDGEFSSINNGSDELNFAQRVVSLSGLQRGDLVTFRIERKGVAAADTLNADLDILSVALQYNSR